MSKTISCPDCDCPIELKFREAHLDNFVYIPGFVCYACKIIIPHSSLAVTREDLLNLYELVKTQRRNMNCKCGFKMDFITDLYIIHNDDETVLLPGYLCPECEAKVPHRFTIDIMKKIGV